MTISLVYRAMWVQHYLNYSFFEPIETDGEGVAGSHREVSYHIAVWVVGKDGFRSNLALLTGKYEVEL